MHKVFHSCDKLTINDVDIDKAFGSIYQSIIKKILLGKIGFLKQLWIIVLRFLSAIIG